MTTASSAGKAETNSCGFKSALHLNGLHEKTLLVFSATFPLFKR